MSIAQVDAFATTPVHAQNATTPISTTLFVATIAMQAIATMKIQESVTSIVLLDVSVMVLCLAYAVHAKTPTEISRLTVLTVLLDSNSRATLRSLVFQPAKTRIAHAITPENALAAKILMLTLTLNASCAWKDTTIKTKKMPSAPRRNHQPSPPARIPPPLQITIPPTMILTKPTQTQAVRKRQMTPRKARKLLMLTLQPRIGRARRSQQRSQQMTLTMLTNPIMTTDEPPWY